jgi:hypothetical protein
MENFMNNPIRLPWLNLIFILMMSAYVVFETATDKESITLDEQINRHERMLAGESEFYNPWQYRIFSTLILEGVIRMHRALLSESCPICPYLLLRFLQNIVIFYLCLSYYRLLEIRNPLVIWAGLLILCFTFGNSTFHSDLSFNTYFDVLFYLLAAVLILSNKPYWIIPLTILAALNRETSGLLPLMVLAPFSTTSVNKRNVMIVTTSLALFALVFVGVRWYFGYQPATSIHGMNSPIEFFQYNITFIRLYPLLFGTLGIIPFVTIWGLRKLPLTLQHWFWLIVPVWMIVHLFYSLAVETRLFLVPHTLLFIPGFLILIERWYADHLTAVSVRKE